MPKSKNEEISLPFSGEGTKMAYLEFRGKMPNLVKIAIFWKLRQEEVSASDVLLGIYLNFAKKSRFSDTEVIFWQTSSVFDYFGCVILIFEIRNTFWSILRRIFGPKVKNTIFPCQKQHFGAKFGLICRFLPKYVSLCQKMCSEAHKLIKHNQTIPKPKGLR